MGLDTDAALQHLIREQVRITASVVAVLGDAHAADDVYQQVVLSVLKTGHTFQDETHLLAWALRAARHIALAQRRRRPAHLLDAAALDALEAHWQTAPVAGPPARADALERCLARLPAADRELLRLRYEGGLSCGEVAGRLGRSAEAVYQAFSRLHRKLRECVNSRLATTSDHPGETVP
jgi:RNA polymerase sigma-70 factor (ECF subfamily)